MQLQSRTEIAQHPNASSLPTCFQSYSYPPALQCIACYTNLCTLRSTKTSFQLGSFIWRACEKSKILYSALCIRKYLAWWLHLCSSHSSQAAAPFKALLPKYSLNTHMLLTMFLFLFLLILHVWFLSVLFLSFLPSLFSLQTFQHFKINLNTKFL